MSELMYRNRHFIRFLLDENRSQQSAVISLLTPDQADVISEIVHNIGILPKSDSEREVVTKRKSILNRIGNRNLSYKTRRTLIKRHKILILRLLETFKNKISHVISQQI
jgi:hypothetical protein